MGFKLLKMCNFCGVKVTFSTVGRFMDQHYVDPDNVHDVTVVKRNRQDFACRFRGCRVLWDKEYIDGGLVRWMGERSVDYVAVKRRKMIETEEEGLYHRAHSRVRRLIEIGFSHLDGYGLRYVRAVTRRCSALIKYWKELTVMAIQFYYKGQLLSALFIEGLASLLNSPRRQGRDYHDKW